MGPISQMERRAKLYYLYHIDKGYERLYARSETIAMMRKFHGLANNKAIKVVDTVIARLQR